MCMWTGCSCLRKERRSVTIVSFTTYITNTYAIVSCEGFEIQFFCPSLKPFTSCILTCPSFRLFARPYSISETPTCVYHCTEIYLRRYAAYADAPVLHARILTSSSLPFSAYFPSSRPQQ